MTAAPPLQAVKRVIPPTLKRKIKVAARRATYYSPGLRRFPPRGYRLEDYASWFPLTGEVFLRYLKRGGLASLMQGERKGGRVGLVVTPWVGTTVPWYAIMLAIGLAHRGREVVLIWDDGDFPERDVEGQQRSIAKVLDWVSHYLPVITVSEYGGRDSNPREVQLIDRLTQQNVTWILRGAAPTPAESDVVERIRQSLTASRPLIAAALSGADLDCLVVPGGVYGTSGLFLDEAAARGWRVATFDTDRRIAQICVSGVAAQNGDIPTAFHALWDTGPKARQGAVEVAETEFRDRCETRDEYGFQVAKAGRTESATDNCILIPLNVEWDTAALGRHAAFESTPDWLVSTVTELLALDAGPVVVRQHPSERRELQRSRLDIAGLLKGRFGDDPRLHFVAADDPVSSYDLLRSARLVLPYVSTIGIEAAAMAKPVLISGRCYYSDLGFVWSTTSRDEYFELLHRGLRGELPLLPDQVERAWLCYYLVAVSNRVSTDFTPHPEDFWTWCQQPPSSLFSDPIVADILEAIDTGVPISFLRHEQGDRRPDTSPQALLGALPPLP
jgi:putative intracellular protease/amidase